MAVADEDAPDNAPKIYKHVLATWPDADRKPQL